MGWPQWTYLGLMLLMSVHDAFILAGKIATSPITPGERAMQMFTRPAIWIGLAWAGGFFG